MCIYNYNGVYKKVWLRALGKGLRFHKYNDMFFLQMSWSNDMIHRMNTGELAKDVTEAETLLQMHHERKVKLIISCLNLIGIDQ